MCIYRSVKRWEVSESKEGEIDLLEDDSQSLELADDGLCIAVSRGQSSERKMAVGLLDSTIQLYHCDSHKHFLSLYGHKLPVMTVAFSDDSEILASAGADKSIKVWSPKFGNCLRSIRAHESRKREGRREGGEVLGVRGKEGGRGGSWSEREGGREGRFLE